MQEDIIQEIRSELKFIRTFIEVQRKSHEEFIDLDELCRLTGWSKNTCYKYLKKDSSPKTYHFGRFLRFKREEVTTWLNNQIENDSRA